MKPRRKRWAGYVAQIEKGGTSIGYWWENQRKEATQKTKTRVGE
jgi:hypothetical protein